MLDVLFLYLDQVNELPHHAYFAANILRELCAVKPSLQKVGVFFFPLSLKIDRTHVFDSKRNAQK